MNSFYTTCFTPGAYVVVIFNSVHQFLINIQYLLSLTVAQLFNCVSVNGATLIKWSLYEEAEYLCVIVKVKTVFAVQRLCAPKAVSNEEQQLFVVLGNRMGARIDKHLMQCDVISLLKPPWRTVTRSP